MTSLILTYSRRKTAGVFGDGSRAHRTLFWFCNRRGHQVHVSCFNRHTRSGSGSLPSAIECKESSSYFWKRKQENLQFVDQFQFPKKSEVNFVQTVDAFYFLSEFLERKGKLSLGRCIKSRYRQTLSFSWSNVYMGISFSCYCFICVFPAIVNCTGSRL